MGVAVVATCPSILAVAVEEAAEAGEAMTAVEATEAVAVVDLTVEATVEDAVVAVEVEVVHARHQKLRFFSE